MMIAIGMILTLVFGGLALAIAIVALMVTYHRLKECYLAQSKNKTCM
jgi:hypothetical protein